MEVVWSSPVQTGSVFRPSNPLNDSPGEAAGASAAPTVTNAPAQDTRTVFAFESDLFDGAYVHWEDGQNALTLEMIPGFRKPESPDDPSAYLAESVSSGNATPAAGVLANGITTVTGADEAVADAQPFQPDVSHWAGGPMKVREDGIEDPVAGWRPTGVVFFETLSGTPPRGTVYSSSLRDAFAEAVRPAETDLIEDLVAGYSDEHAGPHSTSNFFNIPDTVPATPADETEDLSVEVVVVGGGGGGGDGTWVYRLFGKLLLGAVLLFGFLLVLVLGTYGYYIKKRLYDGEPTGRLVTVTIKPGDTFRSVITSLNDGGVLRSFMGLDDRYIMRYLAYAMENSDQVKAGVYKIDTGQNLQEVYNRLIAGSNDFKVTIPEGKTALEVARQVSEHYKDFSPERFMELVNDPEYARKHNVDAPSLEGYLYPSTYFFGPGMKEEELLDLMVGTFMAKVDAVKDKMTTDSLSFHEHVIMASLIEREARLNDDRPLIASVIFNRMKLGMPLQIDATVNYALDDWRRLTYADYRTDHPYNTYKIKGLPPGPITTPRIESLLATYNAPPTDYLYYVHKGDGYHAFAETYAQHQANVGRYIRERNASSMGNEPAADGGVRPEPTEGTAARATEEKSPSRASGRITVEPATARSTAWEEEATAPKAKSY